jgi:orotidine-5'-phosphate decarboxylase
MKPIIVALDFDRMETALAFADRLSPDQCRLKVGLELYTSAGGDLIRRLHDRGFDIFLDLKFHDIPNTVAAACRQAAQLGIWMLNVHALGGLRMMQAAREAIEGGAHRPRLVAVTVLTSHSDSELQQIGITEGAAQEVARLADLTAEAGLDGVVCSAHEARFLREEHGDGFLLVTPGIRLQGDAANDQVRIMDPVTALQAGSSYLVIGRSITQAGDPQAVLERIGREIAVTVPA